MKILAHRGWWKDVSEKNSSEAFDRAFRAGFGIETDLRDHNGRVVIAHDVPTGEGHLTLDSLLKMYNDIASGGTLALNIKADGLQEQVKLALQEHGISNAFVFDMSVPDALGYISAGIRTYTRQSEYEPVPSFYEQCHGVWIDFFKSDWLEAEVLDSHISQHKKIALVSPELHRRPHLAVWEKWGEFVRTDQFICTDFPDLAEACFNGVN